MLTQLREGIAGIYAQKKINKLENIEDTQDWEEFVREIKTAFSDKSKIADVEWKIEIFWQGKKHIADFMIEFETLAMKAEIDVIHAIFLLKKNIWADIIKTILGYPLIAASNTLKEWKMAITSVRQGYESMESWYDYKTSTRTTFRGKRAPMDIGKAWDSFDENGRLRCFNCNVYRHIARKCRKPKQEKEIRKCYKCDKIGHLAKDCRSKQKMKIRRNQEETEESDEEEDDRKEGFVKGSE